MTATTFSDVRIRIKSLTELIQRLERAEDDVKTLSNEKVKLTVWNCLEVALRTLREDRSKMEDQFRHPLNN